MLTSIILLTFINYVNIYYINPSYIIYVNIIILLTFINYVNIYYINSSYIIYVNISMLYYLC